MYVCMCAVSDIYMYGIKMCRASCLTECLKHNIYMHISDPTRVAVSDIYMYICRVRYLYVYIYIYVLRVASDRVSETIYMYVYMPCQIYICIVYTCAARRV